MLLAMVIYYKPSYVSRSCLVMVQPWILSPKELVQWKQQLPMMTDMINMVPLSGTGTNAAISGIYRW